MVTMVKHYNSRVNRQILNTDKPTHIAIRIRKYSRWMAKWLLSNSYAGTKTKK